VVHKMSLKAESRPPGSDPYKTRVIFVVSAIKTYLDRVAFAPVMERSYGVGSNAIGHKWKRGGASRFARFFCANPRPGTPPPTSPYSSATGNIYLDSFFVSLDISKFDQSVLAGLLMLCLFLPWLLYARDNHDFKMVERLILWSISNSVVKVVKWFGDEWRMVFGLMFSGELMTSLGDSWYLEIIMECFDQYLKDLAPPSASGYFRFKDYGDDGVLAYPMSLFPLVCPDGRTPTLLRDYLKQYWMMDLKMSDTHVSFPSRNMGPYGPFVTVLKDDRVVYKGVKFLKRHIIVDDYSNGLPQELPWRPIEDYISKVSCVAGNNQSIARHLIRLRALALDTYGTNQAAYDFLKTTHDYLQSTCDLPNILRVVTSILSDLMAEEENWGADDEDLFQRVGGRSGLVEIAMGFPEKYPILSEVLRDEYEESLLDAHFKQKIYNSASTLMGL